jgi:hypothetical protein
MNNNHVTKCFNGLAIDIVGILYNNVAIYVAAAGVAVSVVNYVYRKKEFRLKSLTESLSRLNDVKHKEARKVYLYGNPTLASFEILGFNKPTPEGGGASSNDLMTLSKDIVRSDLNEVATLICHKLLDKKIFVQEYWWIIITAWRLLEHDILDRRRADGPPNYMKNFEDLNEMAVDYVSKNHPAYFNYPSMGKIGGRKEEFTPSGTLRESRADSSPIDWWKMTHPDK